MLPKKLLAYLAVASVALAVLFVPCRAVRADEIPEKYRETVHKGLEYLAKQQKSDGHWAANGDQYPVSMTGLAGIAMLMEGSTTRDGKYADKIRKATDWLMSKSQTDRNRDGLIFSPNASETGRYMYGHGFATLFLACVYGDEDDRERREKLKDILTRAVDYIGNAQSRVQVTLNGKQVEAGGWYYTSAKEGHNADEGSVTITQMQALRACRNAGIAVPKAFMIKAHNYLQASTFVDGGVIYSLGQGGMGMGGAGGPGRPSLTAAAIACLFSAGDYKELFFSGGGEDGKQLTHGQRWFKYCYNNIYPGRNVGAGGFRVMGHDEYVHYYFAQAIYSLGDDGWEKMFGPTPLADRLTWSSYRSHEFDELVRTQGTDGSWPSGGGFSVGPVYTTAVYCTIMQLDKGTLPFYQRAMGRSE